MGEQVGKLDHFHPDGLALAVGNVRVVSDDTESQGLGAEGGRRPDPAEADDTKRRPRQTMDRLNGQVTPRPDLAAEPSIDEDDLACDSKQQTDRMVCHLLHAVVRHVAHDDPLGCCGAAVHVVEPDPGANDAPAGSESLDRGGSDGDVVEDDESIGRLDVTDELLLAGGLGALDGGDVLQLGLLDCRGW